MKTINIMFIILGIALLTFAIGTHYMLQEAEGTGLCLKTCQKRLAEEQAAKAAKEAQKYKNMERSYVSIILADDCLFSDRCPTYKQLSDLYDNTNRYLSGDFYLDNKTGVYKGVYQKDEYGYYRKIDNAEQSVWKRSEPIVPNAFEYYRFGQPSKVIFVDPDDYTRIRSKIIIIHPQIYTFLGEGRSSTMPDYKLTWYKDFQITECHEATIGWYPNGTKLLTEILNHFLFSCHSEIGISNEVQMTFPKTFFSDCHRYCEHLKWMEKAKAESKEKFLVDPDKQLEDNEVNP